MADEVSEGRRKRGLSRTSVESRDDLLAATRRILKSSDLDALTLELAAQQAGMTLGDAERIFSGEKDLLLALVADELKTAGTRRRSTDSASTTDTLDFLEMAKIVSFIGAEASDVPPGSDEAETPESRLIRKRGIMPPELDSLFKDLVPENASDSITSNSARLERRLQVIERAFGELVASQEPAAKENAAAIERRLSRLSERLETAEKRIWDEMATLFSVTAETANRLNLVASPMQATESRAPEEADAHPPQTEEDSADEEAGESVHYLAAARRAALQAAEHTNTHNEEHERKQERHKRAVWIGSLSVAAVVLAIAIYQAVGDPPGISQIPAEPPLERLAYAGDSRAQTLMGLNYLQPRDGDPNEGEAIRWLERAASRGEALAQYWLGTIYGQHRETADNTERALRWYGEAAERGNRAAMNNLAVAYAEGWQGEKKAGDAARWLARAADLGFAAAQFNLAVLYESGTGVQQSIPDAYKWYAIAAAQGDEDAKTRMSLLAKRMDADALAAAEAAAANFKPAPMNQDANVAPVLTGLASG